MISRLTGPEHKCRRTAARCISRCALFAEARRNYPAAAPGAIGSDWNQPVSGSDLTAGAAIDELGDPAATRFASARRRDPGPPAPRATDALIWRAAAQVRSDNPSLSHTGLRDRSEIAVASLAAHRRLDRQALSGSGRPPSRQHAWSVVIQVWLPRRQQMATFGPTPGASFGPSSGTPEGRTHSNC